MTRAKHQRHTRSSDLTPKEELDKFLTEHIKYLQREKKRVERFFKENGINGENLETNLGKLEKIIKERNEYLEKLEKSIEERNELKKSIDKYKITQQIAIKLIKNLNREKNEYKEQVELFQQQITSLNDQNQQYQTRLSDQNQELEIMRNWNGIAIADQRISRPIRQERMTRLRYENQFLSQVVVGRAQREISELRDDNQRLNNENLRLEQDLEIVRRLGDSRIASQNVQIRNLQERVEQFSAEQRERGMRTIPMLTRQDAFRHEDDDMDIN
ncbi:45111_t:CDS:2 [Gigaspora margarita]|uniref:45111_t:CDS:1 n=1 Tax=Gigaspora margarita TaxID=4874 RepID=A0ABN7W8N1_GIGMA|nr:45111_t:CDS:2 [Gigaspora margarita]